MLQSCPEFDTRTLPKLSRPSDQHPVFMKLNHEIITSPPLDAATVVMLREAESGFEVLLLRRHGKSDVLGGVHVFPGGKLDPADSAPELLAQLDQSPDTLLAALNEPGTTASLAAGLYVAALREVLEESGVLFAQGAGMQQIAQARALLHEGQPFDEILRRLALRLQTRSLQPWSRWITPKRAAVSTKRFDTRFFVALVPADQSAVHDDLEATESVWLSPREALTQYWAGCIQLAPPQIMSLVHLAHHATAASVLAQARSRLPPLIEPEHFDEPSGRVLCYPGDTRHQVRERALPGPTRLYHRNGRFEPEDGLVGLLA